MVALASTNLSPPVVERDDELVLELFVLAAPPSADCTHPVTVTVLLSRWSRLDEELLD